MPSEALSDGILKYAPYPPAFPAPPAFAALTETVCSLYQPNSLTTHNTASHGIHKAVRT